MEGSVVGPWEPHLGWVYTYGKWDGKCPGYGHLHSPHSTMWILLFYEHFLEWHITYLLEVLTAIFFLIDRSITAVSYALRMNFIFSQEVNGKQICQVMHCMLCSSH